MKKGKKKAREKKTGTTGLSLKWLTKANYSGLKWLSSNFVFSFILAVPLTQCSDPGSRDSFH